MTHQTTGAKAVAAATSGPSDPQSTDQGVREKIARIIRPDAFEVIEWPDGMLMSRWSAMLSVQKRAQEVALAKADAILSLLAGDGSSQAQQSPAGLGLHPSEDQAPSADNQEGH